LRKNFNSKENKNYSINQLSIINISIVLNELEKEIEKENFNESKKKILLEKIFLIKTKKLILIEIKKKNKLKLKKYFKKWKYQIFKKFYKELIFSFELKYKINDYKIFNLFLKEKINFLKKKAIFCEKCKKFERKLINNILKKNFNKNDDENEDEIDEDYVDYLDLQLNKSKENIQNFVKDKNLVVDNLKNNILNILKEIKKNFKNYLKKLKFLNYCFVKKIIVFNYALNLFF
jgi:hypothetical protein